MGLCFAWGVDGVGNLCYNWIEFFIELEFNSPTSYFVFSKLVHVGFALKGHVILAIKCFEN
jgi:hypothetical protein